MKKGDEVWAYDFVAKQWKVEKVNEPLVHEFDGTLVEIQVDGEKITSTDNHPYWVESGTDLAKRPAAEDAKSVDNSAASSAVGRWVAARDLRTGDTLVMKSDKKAKIETIVTRKDKVKVYNMNVGSLHTYAVGKSGILVHNKACMSTTTGTSSSSTTGSSSTSGTSSSSTTGGSSSTSGTSSSSTTGGSTSSSSGSTSTSSGYVYYGGGVCDGNTGQCTCGNGDHTAEGGGGCCVDNICSLILYCACVKAV